MVYNSSFEAVKELILVAENGGYVSWISDKDSRLINGLDYCLVEVTCRSGAQYAVQAYGDEALKLYNVSKDIEYEQQRRSRKLQVFRLTD
jgi:hypothetical protein